MPEDLNTEINTRFENSNFSKKSKNINSWADSIFGKEIPEMNDEEKKRVISYIIIVNDNIGFKGYLDSLSKKIGVKNDKKFRNTLSNSFPPKVHIGSIVDDRTDLLHKLVFLVEVENNINTLKEKFQIEKEDIVIQSKKEKKDLSNYIHIEAYIIPEKTKYHYSEKVSKDEIKKYQDELSKLGLYKGEISGEIGKDFLEAVKSFQKSKGLVEDGRIGEKSAQLLENKALTINNKETNKSKINNTIISPDEIKSVAGRKGHCSGTAGNNLNTIFGINDRNRGDAKDLITKSDLIVCTKNNISDKIMLLNEKHQANVFDIYFQTKKGHRAVAYIGENGLIYVLDLAFGASKATPIENYIALNKYDKFYIGYKDANGKPMKSNTPGLAQTLVSKLS